MRKNNKNQNTIFLMVVGFVFIAISGVLFATTAWKILPMVVKQVFLCVMAIGFFGGSYMACQNQKLKKTEAALYYLGTIFIGLFSAAVFGEWGKYEEIGLEHPFAWKLFFANVMMMIPTVIRLLNRKKWFDYIALVVFADGAIWFAIVAFELKFSAITCIMAVIVLLLSVGEYFQEQWVAEDNTGLKTAFIVSYIIHISLYIAEVFLGMMLHCMEEASSFLLASVLLVSTLLIYKRKKETIIRVCNSIAIMWCIMAGVDFINSMMPELWQLSFFGNVFVAYVINTVIALILLRKELLYTQAVIGFLAPFVQLLFYGEYYLAAQEELYADVRYLPFSIVMAFACIALLFRWMGDGSITWQDKGKKFVKVAEMQVLTTIILMTTIESEFPYKKMVMYVLLAIAFLTVSLLQKEHSTEKNVLQTIALLASEFAAFNQPFFIIPENFSVEWRCFLLALGIVILRFVWYDKKKVMGMVCFIFTCILMIQLLLHNIEDGELANVIILGIIGVIMLLANVCLNNRKYAVLAMIVLLMMAVYITRNFWLSIAWWIYLFAAGVLLVILAIKKECES